MIRSIAGRHNDSIKLAAKLQQKKYRRDRGLFLIEGFDLLESALRSGESPVEILVRSDLLERLPASLRGEAEADELDIGVCAEETLAAASGLGGAADVIAVFEADEWSLADLDLSRRTNVYLYGIGDPGNVGTIVRSAVAFGVTGLLCSPGTADPYSPKAMRAGMGAQFNARIVTEVSAGDLSAKLAADSVRGEHGPHIYLADPRGDLPARDLSASAGGTEAPGGADGALLVLGSERGELPELPGDVRRVAIRQAGLDSLNVAMAGTILLYELTNERRRHASEGQHIGPARTS
jgi:RNA methyltransferase, TrmH family